MWDTAGQEEFDRLRSLSYDDSQAVMLCFGVCIHHPIPLSPTTADAASPLQVDSPISLENIEAKWLAEVREHCPRAKLVLAALKCDLREEVAEKEDGSSVISYQQGVEIAKRVGASRYLGMSLIVDCGAPGKASGERSEN